MQGQILLYEYARKNERGQNATAAASQPSGLPNPDSPSQVQTHRQDLQAQVEPLAQQILNVQLNEGQEAMEVTGGGWRR